MDSTKRQYIEIKTIIYIFRGRIRKKHKFAKMEKYLNLKVENLQVMTVVIQVA